MYKLSWINWMGIVLCFLSAGCRTGGESADGPKQRLQNYISQSFSVSDLKDRDALLKFLNGPAKTRLAAWSEEQFEDAFLKSKRQFIRLVFSEVKNLSPKEVSVTYELTYVDQSKGQDAKVTDKKLAQMLQEDGRWYISEVKNIKQMIEYKNEMALP